MATGVGALLCGALAIAVLPVAGAWQLWGTAAWMVIGGRDLWLIAAGYKQCARIRLHHDGSVQTWTVNGGCEAAVLCAGSVVTRRFAWLRIELAHARRPAVLLRRKTAQNKDWRRLQVIWRHLGAGR